MRRLGFNLTLIAGLLQFTPLLWSQGVVLPVSVPPARTATIAGVVVRATSGEAIPYAQVTVTRVAGTGSFAGAGAGSAGAREGSAEFKEDTFMIPPVTTDGQGRFEIEDLDAGSFRIVAARNGFARQEYGQRAFNRPGTVLNIRSGQHVQDIVFRLTPAATIQGRVVDARGEPQPGVTVQALSPKYDSTGARTLQPVASVRTNDLGEYRLYWINPGRYYINAGVGRSALDAIPEDSETSFVAAAVLGSRATANEVRDSFRPLYYPGTPDVSSAVPLDLPPGAEIRSIDFRLPPTEQVRIRGRVIDAETGQPPQNATVVVFPRDSTVASPMHDIVTGGLSAKVSTYNPASGEFEIRGVATGAYWVHAQAFTLPSGSGDEGGAGLASAPIPLDVSGGNIDNLTVTVRSGMTLAGRVRMEGLVNSTETPFGGMRLTLRGAASLQTSFGSGTSAQLAADGTFSVHAVTPGDYTLVIEGMAPMMFIKDARLGQTDALPGVSITDRTNERIELTLSPNGGQIDGALTMDGLKPAGNIQAVLIPERSRNRQELYKTAVSDSDGRFTIRGITPGDYRLFAWEDIEPFSYFDPEVLNQFERRGKLIHIQESSKETVEIAVIQVLP